MPRVRIETLVNPTENPAKVRAAVLNIFPDAAFAETEGKLNAEASSLEMLKELFRKQAIRDSARRVLLGSLHESQLVFALNKQAAFVGRANFAPPSPMGPILVTIEDDDLEGVIEYVTEKSKQRGSPPRPEGGD